MEDPEDWRQLIEDAASRRPKPLPALEYRAAFATQTMPVVLLCEETGGHMAEYVVKAKSSYVGWRSLFNEQVIGRLGQALGAPVPPIALIDVPNELIAGLFQMRHMLDGIAHGSRVISHVTDSDTVRNYRIPENRARFAALAVLYGWVGVDDVWELEFIYDQSPSGMVYSVDHGDFFPRGPEWRARDLERHPPAIPNPTLRFRCGLRRAELSAVAAELSRMSNTMIAEAVSAPPDRWEVPIEDRIAVARYLSLRRDELLAILDPAP